MIGQYLTVQILSFKLRSQSQKGSSSSANQLQSDVIFGLSRLQIKDCYLQIKSYDLFRNMAIIIEHFMMYENGNISLK